MMRTIGMPVLALGAVLAANGIAGAQDSGGSKPGKDTGFTMTLGGSGTAAAAASADDTQLTHWYRRYWGYGGGYYGGYRGYYGGYGLGWGGGWGGSYISYGYANPYFYRPYYRPFYYRPYFFPRPIAYAAYRRGYYAWIGANEEDLNTAAITLGSSQTAARDDIVQPLKGIVADEGSFLYDGGPANPVPLPKSGGAAEANSLPATSLPVALPKSKPAAPYTYKAYGEK